MRAYCFPSTGVTPAKAGAHPEISRWIPAFAGMTPVSGWQRSERQKMEASMSLDAQIATLRAEIAAATAAAGDETQIEAVRVSALGKKGSVSALSLIHI